MQMELGHQIPDGGEVDFLCAMAGPDISGQPGTIIEQAGAQRIRQFQELAVRGPGDQNQPGHSRVAMQQYKSCRRLAEHMTILRKLRMKRKCFPRHAASSGEKWRNKTGITAATGTPAAA
jgi:ribosomal protein S14